jgi:membrane associated rhomboid family serine protease
MVRDPTHLDSPLHGDGFLAPSAKIPDRHMRTLRLRSPRHAGAVPRMRNGSRNRGKIAPIPCRRYNPAVMTAPLPRPHGSVGPRPPGDGPGWRMARFWSISTWLIAINFGVYVLGIVWPGITEWGEFSADSAVLHGQVWRCLTFQFLHASPLHLLFNMIALYFFGPMVERTMHRWSYLAFYLLSGIGGALAYLVLWRLLRSAPMAADPGLIGASAGIFGVLVAAATVAPNSVVRVWFILPLRLRTLVWVTIGIEVLFVLAGPETAGGSAAHLGGALVGWILAKNRRWLDVFHFSRRGRRKQRFWRPGDPPENFFRQPE